MKDNIFRKIALIRLEEVSDSTLDSIISKKPNGIVIITPKSFNPGEGNKWAAIYKFFFDKSKAPDSIPTIPVNFVAESPEILEIYSKFFSKDSKSSEKLFIIKNEEPKQLPPLILEDFFVFSLPLNLRAPWTKAPSSQPSPTS